MSSKPPYCRSPQFCPPTKPGAPARPTLSPICHPGLDPGSRALLVFSVVGAASNAARPFCFCMCSAPSHGAISRAPPGRGSAPVPKLICGRGLSERSEFRSPSKRDRGKGPRRVTPGRPWFWVLLPKQKDLGVRGRSPARTFFLLSSSTLVIEDPASCFCFQS